MRQLPYARLATLAATMVLWGCTVPHSAAPAVGSTVSTVTECPIPEGWAAVAGQGADFVVFGETHGSSEAPALVADLVCALAMRGEPVLLAVEHSSIFDDAFQAAWEGPAEALPVALAAAGWTGREDGVASEAMLQLVQRAHRLKLAGYPVSIVAFNGVRDDAQRDRFANLPAQGPHEAAQAENIAQAASRGTYEHVIVLVGSLHAQKVPAEMNGQAFEPMAMHLAQYGQVTSLVMRSGPGETWNCQLRADYELVLGEPITDDAIACGAYAHRGNGELDRDRFMALGDFAGVPLGASYDGYFWVGNTTASPPAFPN